MEIQKTNLNIDKIKNILKNQYNIEVIKITKIDRGTSNIFKIESTSNKYILKEFIRGRTKETILKEIKIINFLRQRGINVPKYIKNLNNNFYTVNEKRILTVQEFINGYTVNNNVCDYEKVIELARILGKLTKELMEYPELSEENIIEEQFSKKRLEHGIEKMENLRNNIKKDNKYRKQIIEDIDYKIKVSKKLISDFNFNIIKKLTMLNSHGDFCTQQLIYHEETEPTIIDFEKAEKLPIVWEIIRSYNYADREIKINTLVDYFKEVTKYIKLNEYDIKYAPYIYLLQLISSTYGYKEYNNDFSQIELIEFAFFRTKTCKRLYENAEEISSKLIKNIQIKN